MAEGEYVYCIIRKQDTPETFNINGFDGKEVYTISFKNLSAVASKALIKKYKPTEENIIIHRDVSMQVMKEHSVLPVAFGQVFKNKGVLLHNMRHTYGILLKSMREMTDMVELGVKAIIPKDVEAKDVFNEISPEDGRKQIEKEFSDKLGGLALKTKVNKLFSERLIVNQSYLVNKDKLGEFSEAVTELTEKFSNLKLQYTGPWPPYNFVSIRILGRGA